MAVRKRSAAAFQRLNEPSQRVWVSADVDKTVHLDDRALAALLRAERSVQPNIEHFKTIQTEITESMRRAIVTRMNEVFFLFFYKFYKCQMSIVIVFLPHLNIFVFFYNFFCFKIIIFQSLIIAKNL